jgi:hypothetical protein
MPMAGLAHRENTAGMLRRFPDRGWWESHDDTGAATV